MLTGPNVHTVLKEFPVVSEYSPFSRANGDRESDMGLYPHSGAWRMSSSGRTLHRGRDPQRAGNSISMGGRPG